MNEHAPRILTIVGSTRPGRIGRSIAEWFQRQATQQHDVQFEIVDLAEWSLPFLDEPAPAKMRMYRHDHTRKWSDRIAGAAGYVLVTPEYNHGYPASLKNALDYLYHEWSGKPVGFVGYGWGGGRGAVDQLSQVVKELRMQALPHALLIPLTPAMFDDRHQIVSPDQALSSHEDDARGLVDAVVAATQPAWSEA